MPAVQGTIVVQVALETQRALHWRFRELGRHRGHRRLRDMLSKIFFGVSSIREGFWQSSGARAGTKLFSGMRVGTGLWSGAGGITRLWSEAGAITILCIIQKVNKTGP